MCLSKLDPENINMLNRSRLGLAIPGVLAQAKLEKRLVCGLLPAISYLEKTPEDALICLFSETKPGDSSTHLQTVLLQSFCHEHCIPQILVDSSLKLAELCEIQIGSGFSPECLCAIITRNMEFACSLDSAPSLSVGEQKLADFYEFTINDFPKPVITLPGSTL